MSPISMALIRLLAYKALKHFGGGQQQGTAARTCVPFCSLRVIRALARAALISAIC